jgi:hypothetical protein
MDQQAKVTLDITLMNQFLATSKTDGYLNHLTATTVQALLVEKQLEQ